MSRGIQGYLRRLQERKPVAIMVHSKRDMRSIRDLYGLKTVYHHPLSFIARAAAQRVRQSTPRAAFPLLQNLPESARLIGTFGFLSPYKGFETVVQALKYLPETHHLLIFGGIHPQTIKREEAVDPYILKLFRAARIGQTPLDHLRESNVPVTPSGDVNALLADHPGSLRARVHFMGALSDEQFYAAMALCDIAVFPYLEVGQSSSGPISIALEMGTRVIASRTAAFRAYARYHPGLVEFFDIGNYAELATRILAEVPRNVYAPHLTYNTETNVALYLRANGIMPQPVHSLANAAE
jgi:glycosyltransferase involved in cell wall biosynthesis